MTEVRFCRASTKPTNNLFVAEAKKNRGRKFYYCALFLHVYIQKEDLKDLTIHFQQCVFCNFISLLFVQYSTKWQHKSKQDT